jgi:hypothetical protein
MLSPASRLVLDTLLPGAVSTPAFDEFWAEFERTALPAWRWSFRAAALTATWVAPLLIRRLPPLARHDRPTRERALAALGASRSAFLRQMLSMLKTVLSLHYGADPAVRALIGAWARTRIDRL